MAEGIYQQNYPMATEDISVEYRTTGRVLPVHWHDNLEIIYLLNGSAEILLDGQTFHLVTGDLIVIDSGRIHESHCEKSYMQIVIRISENFIRSLMGGRRDFRIVCSRYDLTHETLASYMEIRHLFRELVPLYIQQPRGYQIKSRSLVLDVLYHLISDFTVPDTASPSVPEHAGSGSPAAGTAGSFPETDRAQRRVWEIARYISDHYREPLTLDTIAGHFGLSPEYFSRMFRKTFGIPYTQHLQHVRIAHIHHDLCTTDDPVMAIAERHGFTNYKLFLRMFRETYGNTPREIRRQARFG